MMMYRLASVVGLGLLLLGSTGCTRHIRPGAGGGEHIGPYRLTVYWLAHERWYRGSRRSPIYSKRRRIAWVSKRFAQAIRFQGSGILRNGQIVQYVARCQPRSRYCLRVRKVNRRRYPAGIGAAGVALRPLRSLAIDRRQISFGTRLYIPQLGRILRARGKVHNGCFVAHDTGGRIKGARLDLFVGRRGVFRRYLKGSTPREVQVYINHPRCRGRHALRR